MGELDDAEALARIAQLRAEARRADAEAKKSDYDRQEFRHPKTWGLGVAFLASVVGNFLQVQVRSHEAAKAEAVAERAAAISELAELRTAKAQEELDDVKHELGQLRDAHEEAIARAESKLRSLEADRSRIEEEAAAADERRKQAMQARSEIEEAIRALIADVSGWASSEQASQVSRTLVEIAEAAEIAIELSQPPPDREANCWDRPEAFESRENIDWVMWKDSGAGQRFRSARSRGYSVYDALISAQSHNEAAQRTIEALGRSCVEEYVRAVYPNVH